jgi:hypothetical protein
MNAPCPCWGLTDTTEIYTEAIDVPLIGLVFYAHTRAIIEGTV